MNYVFMHLDEWEESHEGMFHRKHTKKVGKGANK